jgi:hypothetical protein
MLSIARLLQSNSPDNGAHADRATQAIVLAIDTLIDGLTPAEKELVLQKITERLRPIPVPQAGDVLGMVVRLIPRDREWTVSELKKRVEQQSVPITAKEIYNALGYLTRKGHIQRLGYGRYIIDGVPVVTADDLGGNRSITEGDSDD